MKKIVGLLMNYHIFLILSKLIFAISPITFP